MWWKEPFFEVALPIVLAQILNIVAVVMGFITQNKRTDDLRDSVNRRLDEIIKRLDRIDSKVDQYDHRIAVLEEQTSPFRR